MTEKIVYRMSETGYCSRAIVADRLKYPKQEPPPWLKTSAREGKRHEKWIKEDLTAEGYVIEDCEICPICMERLHEERNGLHVELHFDTFDCIGHTDGRAYKNGHKSGLEIKTLSQFEFDRWMKDGFQGDPQKAAQITLYMEADPNEDWLYVVKNRSSGYTVKGTLSEAPGSYTELVDRLAAVTDFIQRGVLPASEFDSSSIQCRRCEFQALCIPVLKAPDPIEEAKILEAAQNWRKGKVMATEGKQLIDSAVSVFSTHSRATGLKKWRFDELSIVNVHVKESISYPKARLLTVFKEEQLKPASEIKLSYDYVKVDDLRREQEENGNAEMSE